MLRNLIDSLNNGILPDELNFSLKNEDPLDLEKVRYNTFYKDPEYYKSKLPKAIRNMPGADAIAQNMADNADTPLEAILKRQKEHKYYSESSNGNKVYRRDLENDKEYKFVKQELEKKDDSIIFEYMYDLYEYKNILVDDNIDEQISTDETNELANKSNT